MSKTVTSIFMVPTLKIPKELVKSNGFIDAYIKDLQKDVNYENCIYLLFKPDNIDSFREFLDSEYQRSNSIVEDYDYQNGYVVIVYKLNESFNEDFALIRNGKYSKVSNLFKSQFSKTVRIIGEDNMIRTEKSLQFHIFEKTESLKLYWEEKLSFEFDDDMEVWQAFDEESEVLDINKLLKAT
jgi:hypothetical protein